jgi:hypothetical protein
MGIILLIPLLIIAAVLTLQYLGVSKQWLPGYRNDTAALLNAEKAPVVNPTPAFSPFTAPELTKNDAKQDVRLFHCVRETTPVDLPTGTAITYGNTRITIAQKNASGVQESVSVTVQLGKKTSLPGMIIHTHATLADPINVGNMSDRTFLTRMPAGQKAVWVLETSNPLTDAINRITFCFQ